MQLFVIMIFTLSQLFINANLLGVQAFKNNHTNSGLADRFPLPSDPPEDGCRQEAGKLHFCNEYSSQDQLQAFETCLVECSGVCADQLQAATPSFKLDHPFTHAYLPQWQSELEVYFGLRGPALPQQMYHIQTMPRR